jgi:hypothetical protein
MPGAVILPVGTPFPPLSALPPINTNPQARPNFTRLTQPTFPQACLFWFGFTLPPHAQPWPVPLAATLLFGACQVAIFNTTQNYYIDAFEKYAASALAAGAVLRSLMAGQIPLYVGGLFDKYGYGIGMSVFGGVAVLLMPAPVVFWYYGGWVRERFASDLS